MRRGSLLFAGAVPALPPSFVPVAAEGRGVSGNCWHASWPISAARSPGCRSVPSSAHAGDLAVQGHGEL
jgi:hypothetical protein